MNAIGQGLTVVDATGRFTYVNPAYAQMVGYTPADLIGGGPERVTLAEDHDKLDQAWSDRRKGKTTSYETRLQHRDGHIVHAFITSVPLVRDGVVSGSIAVITDLTDRRRMEEALRRRVAFENLVTSLSTRFIDVCADDLDTEITAALEAVGTFADVDRAYVFLFSPDGEFVHNTHEWCAPGIPPEIENLQGVPAAMLPWWMGRIWSLDNVHIPRVTDLPEEAAAERAILEPQGIQSLIAVPLVYAKQPLGFLGFDAVRGIIQWSDDDISLLRVIGEIIVSALERRRSEQEIAARTVELAVARDQAVEASDTKSRFLATMSHELRTPLNAIVGFTELLLVTSLDEQQRELAETVRISGESLLAIVNDILDLSRIEANKLELEVGVFAPRECLAEALAMVTPPAAAKALALSSTVDRNLPDYLLGDAFRLRQMLVNLLSNAVKFTEHGKVSLEVDWVEHKDAGHALRAVVRDTGIGITAEQIAGLFRPFSQGDASTARRFGGSGLGLAITKRLAGLMSGSLDLESEPGQGSAFYLTVPLAVPSPEQVLSARSTPGEGVDEQTVVAMAATHPLRILLAEDSPVNQKLALSMLAQLGYEADVARNGIEALATLSESTYDVVLMDVEMPDMDGLAAAKAIRETLPATRRPRIVAVTAHALHGDRERFLAEGTDDYLGKPIQLRTLAAALQRCLRLHAPPARESCETVPTPASSSTAALTAAPNPPSLDAAVLAELRVVVNAAGPDAVSELVDLFVAYGAEQTRLLNEALNLADLDEVRKAAHALASSAGNLGAAQLASLARAVEASARAGEREKTAHLTLALIAEYQRVVAVLCSAQ